RRLGKAVGAAAVLLGLAALAFDVGHFRPWVFGVLPVTGLALAAARLALRGALHGERANDRCMHPVLAAGSVDEISALINRTRRERHYGWEVTGVCLPDDPGPRPALIEGVPVLGALADVSELARRGGYRIVAVMPDPYWDRSRIRQLAWDLEGVPTDLVFAPA